MVAAKKAVKSTSPKITVVKQPEKAFRTDSARDLYWQRVQKFNGKELSAFKADCETNTPSTPTKGKLAGKPEPVTGWISWFVNQGLVKIG